MGSPGDIRISVALGAELGTLLAPGSPSGAAFRDGLADRVQELLAQTGIGLEASIDVGGFPAGSEGEAPWGVSVDDRPCEVALPVEVSPDLRPEQLADLVAGAIADNRDLLAPPGAAERLRREWEACNPSVEWSALGVDGFQSVLAELLRRCISVAPRQIEGLAGADAVSPDRLWEAIIGARGIVSLRVLTGQDQAAAPTQAEAEQPSRFTSDIEFSVASALLGDSFFDELGLLLPEVAFEVSPALGEGRFQIEINDVRFPPRQGLLPDEAMVNARPESLAEIGVTGRRGTHPVHGLETTVIHADDEILTKLRDAGLDTWGPQGFVVLTLAREIRRHAGAFLLPDVVIFQLRRLRAEYPVAVESVLRRVDSHRLTAILRRLLDEEVSMRDLIGVVEALLGVDGGVSVDQSRYRLITPNAASVWPVPEGVELSAPGIDQYADCVRRHNRDQGVSLYMDTTRMSLPTLDVDERLEARLRSVATRPLDDVERAQLRKSVWAAYESAARQGLRPVVLTNSEIRRTLRGLLERAFPALPVVSDQELRPGTRPVSIEKIAWP